VSTPADSTAAPKPATPAAPAELAPLLLHESQHLRWYHLEEPESPLLDRLAQEYNFHELEIEDCRHLRHTAKIEEYENHVFLIANTLHFVLETLGVWFGELDFFIGQDFLVTVHTGPTRSVKDVLVKVKAMAKLQRPDRVLHALLDNMVDRYLPVLDDIEEQIEEFESMAYENPSPELLTKIFVLKRALISFRRVAGMMREVVNHILYREEEWLRSQHAYFRNVYDHVVRALDFAETYRDILTGVLDVHLTATANRTNETMKILTIFATLATPFLLVTGYYGMNFEYLPLLHHPYGFAIVSVGMVVIALGMLWFFRKRGWI